MDNNYDLQLEIKPYLSTGESILWCDKPCKTFVFTVADIFTTLFGIVWLGFSVFWFLGAFFATQGQTDPMAKLFPFFGVPFICVGLYLLFFRHIVSAISRKRIIYALTDKRAIIVHTGRREYLQEFRYENISNIHLESKNDDVGSINFLSNQINYVSSNKRYANSSSGFFGIRNVKNVYKILSECMENKKI